MWDLNWNNDNTFHLTNLFVHNNILSNNDIAKIYKDLREQAIIFGREIFITMDIFIF